MSNAQDERRTTIHEGLHRSEHEKQAREQNAADREATVKRANADYALSRLANAIDNLSRETETLSACLHQRWTGGPEHIRSYCETLLADAEEALTNNRMTLSAARGFYASDPDKTCAICQNIQAATEYKATACQVAIAFLERFGYITFGHLRAVGGFRGD